MSKKTGIRALQRLSHAGQLRCLCGKYMGDICKGVICERCGTELITGDEKFPAVWLNLSWLRLSQLWTFVDSWAADNRRTSQSRAEASAFLRDLKNAMSGDGDAA